jgi:hypothetical protein
MALKTPSWAKSEGYKFPPPEKKEEVKKEEVKKEESAKPKK